MLSDKQKTPFFSIVIPVYNRAYILSTAIESCLKQLYENFELIIVDDASADHSLQIAQSYKDERIKIIVNEQNKERCVSRNIGIKAAKGDYICFLDSDDYFLENHLSDAYKEIEKLGFPEAFFFTNAWNKSAEGILNERFCPNFKEYNPYDFFLYYTVNPPRWIVHHSVFEKLLFDPEIKLAEDMDFTLRLLNLNIPIHKLRQRTVVYYASPDSFTHSDPEKGQKLLHYWGLIFQKPEFKGKLSLKLIKKLKAMAYYFIAIEQFNQGNRKQFTAHALKSLRLDPKGYNKNSTKDLLVLLTKTLFRMK
jgi:glycosyltransferase involved in cell wall biosynthesis